MAIKNITSTDPFKKPVVKVFKDLFSASKVTNVKFDTVKKVYTANCFQKFNFLGNKEINAEDLYSHYKYALD
jgi:hypothetical protein|tara:strand:+ start:743 stop:958 length:216 start_codon:yes stop_codon:yes gene_type:complete